MVTADLALLVRIAGCERLEIGSGAERAAGPGEHSDRSVLVGVEGEKGVVELACGGAVDGIAAMRTVDGDDGDGSIALDHHGIGFGHLTPPFFSGSSFRGDAKHRTRNLEIPRCAIAHLRSGADAPSRNDGVR